MFRIRITRYANANADRAALLGASSLDAVVASLDPKRSITTVEKTSRDWDDFKIREGIDDDLTQKAKDGYLERKEFLNRVDARVGRA